MAVLHSKNAQNWQFGGYQKWHFQWPAINETCWDHPGHQKMSHIDNGPSPSRNYGETAILQILHIFVSFLECKTAIFFKLFPKRQFTVYNAEIFFVTSYNPIAWVVKRAKLNSKKGVLWDTLVNRPLLIWTNSTQPKLTCKYSK